VSTHGDWRGWVEFCLRGVVEQASDTITPCDRLIALYRDFHDRIKAIKGSMRLATVVDDLFIAPAANVTWTARETQVTYPTAKKDLEKLENARILMRIKSVPQIAYICMPILDITYAD
jgi:Fic family protein